MREVLGVLLVLGAVECVVLNDLSRGGWKRNILEQHTPTIPLWASKPAAQRGPPPYIPPPGWNYNTTGGPLPGKINVHLVAHTHDDTGWQVTVDQYFYREVYYIIDTVVARLADNPNRRFIYVETGFFARWWEEQPEAKKNLTRRLVNNGQLEFINGGWCMHDEASPFYVEMVDQTTRGHQFLKKNFGEAARPTGTWQIDPFGHSNTNAWLIGAQSGMTSLFWGRMDYDDLAVRTVERRLEWMWEGSQSLGDTARVFAGQLFGKGGGGYGTWISFDGTTSQVQDDPTRHDYNADFWVDAVVGAALVQAAATKTDHQMWACGSDFNYQNAIHWFHNLDKLIHYVNQNSTINMFYSTPTRYTTEKLRAHKDWEVRKDDIFPLADAPHHYWSGYFTSRPALKRQVRMASNYLNAARQLEVVAGVTDVPVATTRPSPKVGKGWTDSLEGTVGVATHHDGMSGTERQDVSNDYALRIAESMGEVQAGVALSIKALSGISSPFSHCDCLTPTSCLNITACSATLHTAFSVVAYNPLAHPVTHHLRLPVIGEGWRVTGPKGETIPVAVAPLDPRTKSLPQKYINWHGVKAKDREAVLKAYTNNATHVVTFPVSLPPVGFVVVSLERIPSSPAKPQPAPKDLVVLENEYLSLTFDPQTGNGVRITNKVSNVSTPLRFDWGWYNSSVGGCTPHDGPFKLWSCDGQASGAYIFRPNSSTLFFPGPSATPKLEVVRGDGVSEVRQIFSDWAYHTVRLYANVSHVEVEWTAGPIPVDTPWHPPVAYDDNGKPLPNKWGKELVLKYSSGVRNGRVFYTDSNGKEMVRREVDRRGASYPPTLVSEPVAGNYYPVNSMIAISDATTELAVVTDASLGGASLHDGEIELMVHRRVQADDHRGVQEPLNETMCGCNDINASPGSMGEHGREGDGGCECEGLVVRGRHWLVFDTKERAHELRRQLIERLNFPPILAFTQSAVKAEQPEYSALGSPLPQNVRLMTLTNNYGETLLRLSHLYSIGEHPTLSSPAAVDLGQVFSTSPLRLGSITEVSLTADRPPQGSGRIPVKGFTVTLRPMEVRTFVAHFL